jgi:hypothetical protein
VEDDEQLRTGVEGEGTISGVVLEQAPRGPIVPLSTAPPATSTVVTPTSSGPPQVAILPTATLTPPTAAYPLHRVPEDQTGAAKEAMIQAEQMMRRTKDAYEASKMAYDASAALHANVRVSGIVSSFPIEFLLNLNRHPLGVFF